MVQFNKARKEISFKIVYYGPGGSGKTTSMQYIDQNLCDAKKLTSIAVGKENNMYFAFLPLMAGKIYGINIQAQIFSVPGQSDYESVRKLILQDVDGVVFVGDSRDADINSQFFRELQQNLAEHGKNIADLAFIVQWNKRDHSRSLPVSELKSKLGPLKFKEYETTATSGKGVLKVIETMINRLIKNHMALLPEETQKSFSAQEQKITYVKEEEPELDPNASSEELPIASTKKKVLKKAAQNFSEGDLTIDEYECESPAGQVMLLKLKGKVDPKSALNLKTKLDEHLYNQGDLRLILDLEEIVYLHSTAFGMLIESANKAKMMGGGIRLIHVQEKNKVFFEMMCVEGFLPISENEEEALNSFPLEEKKEQILPKIVMTKRKRQQSLASLTGTQTLRMSEFARETTTKKIFISYSKDDIELAERLEKDLKAKNYEVWRGKARLKKDVSWSKEVSQPLKDSDIVILLWTPQAVHDTWVRNEWLTSVCLQKKLIPCIDRENLKLPLLLHGITPISLAEYGRGLLSLGQECKQTAKFPVLHTLPEKTYLPHNVSEQFQGRENDIMELFHQLLENHAVMIKQTPKITKQGIGKTQFVLEFLYKFGFAFDTIMWINGAKSWREEISFAVSFLRITQQKSLQAGFHYVLKELLSYIENHPKTLIVIDNLSDAEKLDKEIVPGVSFNNLNCFLLAIISSNQEIVERSVFTLDVLDPDASYHLLTSTREVHTTQDEEAVKEFSQLTNRIPLALEMARSFLEQNRFVSFQNYLIELKETLPEEDTTPESILKATIKLQYGLLQESHCHLLFKILGQLPENQAFSYDTIALFMGMDRNSELFPQSIQKLEQLSLIEIIKPRSIMLHPEIHQFAKSLSQNDMVHFRKNAAQRLFSSYKSLVLLECECQKRGIEEVLGDIELAYQWSEQDQQIGDFLEALQIEKEHMKRAIYYPSRIIQQVYSRIKGTGKLTEILEKASVNIGSNRNLWPKNTIWLKRQNSSPDPEPGNKFETNAACISLDGKWIATGSNEKISVWEVESGKKISDIVKNDAGAKSVRFSQGAKWLVSNCLNIIEIWDVTQGSKVLGIAAHQDWISALALAPGKVTVASSAKKEIKIWNCVDGKPVCTLPGHQHDITRLEFSSDGERLFSAGKDALVQVWNMQNYKLVKTLKGHYKSVCCMHKMADGKRLLTGGEDGLIKLWDIAKGQTLMTLSAHDAAVNSISVSSDENFLISSGEDLTLKLWNFKTLSPVKSFFVKKPIIECAFVVKKNREIIACDRSPVPEIYKFKIIEIG